jgi:crotonobetainyl-CoA:carnitine CoA-transferase CaiB-like acyl-CoA transferase
MATLHLADMGADVIKIGDTEAGDYSRTMGRVREGMSDSFRLLNRNKRAMRLDLKQARGKEAFLRLARRADVIVESFRPGVVAKLGVGYDAVSAINPRVVLPISGYGQDGPYARRAGHDINYVGYAGVGDQIGTGGVAGFRNQIADCSAARSLPDGNPRGARRRAILRKGTPRRRRHDRRNIGARHLSAPRIPRARQIAPARNRHARRGPRVLQRVPHEGRALHGRGCARAQILGDAVRYTRLPGARGKAHRVRRGRRTGEGAARKIFLAPQREWTEVFSGADCCVSPVLGIGEALSNEQLRARAMIVEADGITQFALPLKMSEFEFAVERTAPAAGEHTDEILREAGYRDAEIGELRKDGVIWK